MSTPLSTHILTQAIESLAEKDSLKGLFHEHRDGFPLPSGTMLEEIVQLARSILFPGYYGNSSVNMQTIRYRIGVDVERLHQLLCQQIMAGLCFAEDHHDCPSTNKEVKQQAEVIAVGPGGMVNGNEVKMEVSVGDKVIYSKYSGTEVQVDEDEEYIIVSQSDILAIIK